MSHLYTHSADISERLSMLRRTTGPCLCTEYSGSMRIKIEHSLSTPTFSAIGSLALNGKTFFVSPALYLQLLLVTKLGWNSPTPSPELALLLGKQPGGNHHITFSLPQHPVPMEGSRLPPQTWPLQPGHERVARFIPSLPTPLYLR